MKKFIIFFVAYMLIYAAADVGRKSESKVELFSKQWFIQLLLVTAGGTMLALSSNWD